MNPGLEHQHGLSGSREQGGVQFEHLGGMGGNVLLWAVSSEVGLIP